MAKKQTENPIISEAEEFLARETKAAEDRAKAELAHAKSAPKVTNIQAEMVEDVGAETVEEMTQPADETIS